MTKPKKPAAKPEAAPKIQVSPMRVFAAEEKMAAKHMTLDSFENFASRLGVNNDNALSNGTYEFNLVTRNRVKLEAAYRGSWVVGSIIDSVADDMTRAGIDLTTNDSEEEIKDFQTYISRKQIWQSFNNLIKWGQLYGGAIAIMQIAGQKLDTPLDPTTVAKGQFQGLAVYDRWQLNPDLQNLIQEGPDMGLPMYYNIVTSSTGMDTSKTNATGQIKVHHSRCIRYTGIDLPYWQAVTEMMWGESTLERLWDRLISFDNATMSSASLIDRANLRSVGIDGLREIIGAGGAAMNGLLAQFEMIRMMQVNEGLTLLDKEDEITSTAYSFAGLSDMMLQFGQQLSGASGIPLVRLFGQSHSRIKLNR
jgi:phage-related protein (TIGR01555 family)